MSQEQSPATSNESTVPCGLCGTPTRMTGTKRCDRCWELESRIHGDPVLAAKILAACAQTACKAVSGCRGSGEYAEQIFTCEECGDVTESMQCPRGRSKTTPSEIAPKWPCPACGTSGIGNCAMPEQCPQTETREPAEIVLRAWQNAFGTTQLTHAKARLEAAESAALMTSLPSASRLSGYEYDALVRDAMYWRGKAADKMRCPYCNPSVE